MNLSKLFETQDVLDERIYDRFPELRGKNNLDWKILALQVELGECANEWRGFKKWSDDREPRTSTLVQIFKDDGTPARGVRPTNPLLEEYVDCLHFILSIGIELKCENKEYSFADNEFVDTLEAFRHVFNWCVNVDFIAIDSPFIIQKKLERAFYNLFMSFVWLGEMLGFTWLQIEEAYYAKNKINHERQSTGY